MTTSKKIQQVLDTPNDNGNYWWSQLHLQQITGSSQPAISKQLNKLIASGSVIVELMEYAPSKTSKHYCLASKTGSEETEVNTAKASAIRAVEDMLVQLNTATLDSAEDYDNLVSGIKSLLDSSDGSIRVNHTPKVVQTSVDDLKEARQRGTINGWLQAECPHFTKEQRTEWEETIYKSNGASNRTKAMKSAKAANETISINLFK